MNLDDLKAKQDAVQQEFDKLTANKFDLEAEVHRLEGEWRLLEGFVKNLVGDKPEEATGQPSGDVPVTVTDPAPEDAPTEEVAA